MKRLNASEVRQNFSECIKEVNEGTPIVVTNRNNSKGDVVIITLEEYEKMTGPSIVVEYEERKNEDNHASLLLKYVEALKLDERVKELEKRMNESK